MEKVFAVLTTILLLVPFGISARGGAVVDSVATDTSIVETAAVPDTVATIVPVPAAADSADHAIPESTAVIIVEEMQPAAAPATTDTITLHDEIVVTANRWAQKKSAVPNRVIAVSSDEVAFRNAQTAADLLGTTGEVFVQKSQLGGGSPMVRGFTANSVLLVVDGVRMNNAIYRAGNLQNVISIDANALDNVEIILGPGSIMYGSDALGGVFNFTSKTPRFSPDSTLSFSGNAMARFSSADREKTGHIGFSLAGKNIASYTAISGSGFDDLRTGKSGDHYDFYKRPDFVERINNKDTVVENPDPAVQTPSGYKQLNILEKIVARPSQNLRLTNSFYYTTTSDFPRYDRLILMKDSVTYKSAQWYYGPQKWLMNAFNVRSMAGNALFDEMSATAAYQNYEESRHDRNFNGRWRSDRTETVNGYSANVDFNKKVWSATQFMYGIEALWNDARSSAHRTDTNGAVDPITIVDTRYPDGFNDYGSGASYGYLTTDWNKKITTIAGIRYSYVHLKSQIKDNRTFYPFLPDIIEINAGALNGAVGLIVKPRENLQLTVNGSSGYRAPNVDDIGKIFAYTAGTVRMPNQGLKPEYAYNLDCGVTAKLFSIITLEGAGFYTYVKDLMAVGDFSFSGMDSIEYNGSRNKITAIVNKSKAFIWGGSGTLSARLSENVSLSNSLSYTLGIEGNDTVPLRPVPPLFGASHLLFSGDKIKTDFYVCYNAQKVQGTGSGDMPINDENRDYLYPLDETGNRLCPAWYTVNLKASYRLSGRFVIDAGVENILDKCYRPYGSGISAPGINFMTALRISL